MTRMTGPDCAVMCNLINTHTHTHIHTHTDSSVRKVWCLYARIVTRGKPCPKDGMRDKWETWAERGKTVESKGLVL